jgi:hypothetical protein
MLPIYAFTQSLMLQTVAYCTGFQRHPKGLTSNKNAGTSPAFLLKALFDQRKPAK